MASIINTCKSANWPIKIVAVIADRQCLAIEKAENLLVPTYLLNYSSFKDSIFFNQELFYLISSLNADLIAMAGFMRIINSKVFGAKLFSFINIHPSLLPAYPGLNTHKRAIDDKVKIHGATVHSITELLDSGPILSQGIVPVLEDDTVSSLSSRVMEIEVKLFPLAIAAILSNKVKLKNNNWVENKQDPSFSNFNFSRKIYHPLYEN